MLLDLITWNSKGKCLLCNLSGWTIGPWIKHRENWICLDKRKRPFRDDLYQKFSDVAQEMSHSFFIELGTAIFPLSCVASGFSLSLSFFEISSLLVGCTAIPISEAANTRATSSALVPKTWSYVFCNKYLKHPHAESYRIMNAR